MSRFAAGWQLLLADMSLILFLFALSALPEADRKAPQEQPDQTSAQMAPAQALFRDEPGGPSLAQWLAARPRDPRATLTVFARHSDDDVADLWNRARGFGEIARAEGFKVRIIISPGERSDLYASLAYDSPQ